jgi:hypothetical protein
MRSNMAPMALSRPKIFMRATFYRTSGGIVLVAMRCPLLQSGFSR